VCSRSLEEDLIRDPSTETYARRLSYMQSHSRLMETLPSVTGIGHYGDHVDSTRCAHVSHQSLVQKTHLIIILIFLSNLSSSKYDLSHAKKASFFHIPARRSGHRCPRKGTYPSDEETSIEWRASPIPPPVSSPSPVASAGGPTSITSCSHLEEQQLQLPQGRRHSMWHEFMSTCGRALY
jgi:hypothetical protein